MYADNITESMKYAIEETNRRREYQKKYNEKFNITPRSISKEIRGKLVDTEESREDVEIDIEKMDIKQKKILIKELQKEMLILADKLDFEKAANLRDQIKEIKMSID